jgi:hypothetical protein
MALGVGAAGRSARPHGSTSVPCVLVARVRDMQSAETRSRLARAIEAIDAANADDPNRIEFGGESHPKERLHAQRATYWVRRLDPEASELLLLAARAHHLRRWQLPRAEYPAGRAGYHAWRRELQRRHAREAARILEAMGFAADEIERVEALICKRGLGRDAEVQVLEDALCLVFVETQLDSFAARHESEKVIEILAKSLRKMSPEGRRAAGTIALSASGRRMLARAIERIDPS